MTNWDNLNNVPIYLDYNDDALDPNNEAEEAGRTAADIEVSHASRIDRYLAIYL